MTDLISRQAVLKELPHALWGKDWDEALAKAIIESIPTVDPVKHGKWIEYPIADGMNQCSVCGVLRFGDSNYCPNCGAEMERSEDAAN